MRSSTRDSAAEFTTSRSQRHAPTGFIASRLSFAGTVACALGLCLPPIVCGQTAPDVEAQVESLLGQMTLEEKAGQMCQFVGFDFLRQNAAQRNNVALTDDDSTAAYPGISIRNIEQMVRDGRIGSFLFVLDPAEARHLQALAQESRLKIPLIIGVDAIHGNGLVRGATVYPTPLSLASSFDEALVERIARETALEVRAIGSHWTFSPTLDVARDARWGRVGETFGEDPLLIGRLGAAMIRGYQAGDRPAPTRVLACIKHFIAGSEPVNGLNGGPMDVSEQTLRSVFLPPYLPSIQAGAGSVMIAHHDLNGVPCHANRWLIEDLLRRDAGFQGVAVSDWMDIERLFLVHHVAADMKEATWQSVMAGLDMHMHGPGFFEPLVQLVREGRIAPARIDASVRRILRAKFELGLFDASRPASEQTTDVLFSPAHQQTALEAARKGIVLLKNDGSTLPIDVTRTRRILLTGPLADSPVLLGDWAFAQPDENITTVREGLAQVAPEGCSIDFFDCGWSVRNIDPPAIATAAARAREADLAVVVVGENAYRPAPFGADRVSGENIDRSDIDLTGGQTELVRAISATGKPVVVVFINTRPLGTEWIAEHVPAIVEAWEPGCKGGQAIAEVLFGAVNPSGRLPMTVPRSAGHIQTIYNHKPSQYFRRYALGQTDPLFWFGHGLSYTTFHYANLRVPAEAHPGQPVVVRVDVTNTGERAGDEVVLVYLNDVLSSVTTPVKELKGFTRLSLAPGETRTAEIDIAYDQLALLDRDMQWHVEPGDFDVFVGNLQGRFTVRP